MAADRDQDTTPAERKLTDSQRQRLADRRPPAPTPVSANTPDEDRGADEITSPLELLLRDDDSEDRQETVQRLRSDSRGPYEMLANLAFALQRKERARRSTGSLGVDLEREVIKAIHDQAVKTRTIEGTALAVAEDVKQLKSGAKLIKILGGALITAALGSIGAGLAKLWTLAEHSGETAVRMQRLEHDVELLLGESRHPSPSPHWAPSIPPPDPKGTP